MIPQMPNRDKRPRSSYLQRLEEPEPIVHILIDAVSTMPFYMNVCSIFTRVTISAGPLSVRKTMRGPSLLNYLSMEIGSAAGDDLV